MRILDGLDLEMQADQTEDETLEVLDQVIEDSETFRIPEKALKSDQTGTHGSSLWGKYSL